MTADEFEQQYAGRAAMSSEQLRATGRVVRPRECDWPDCEGWQSVSHEVAAEIDDPEIPWVR